MEKERIIFFDKNENIVSDIKYAKSFIIISDRDGSFEETFGTIER